MKSREIKLNHKVLKALRETSGYDVEEIARKLKISTDKIISIEKGEASFTLSQIKKLADIYKYSLAAFFSPSIPKLPEVHIYRTNVNNENKNNENKNKEVKNGSKKDDN